MVKHLLALVCAGATMMSAGAAEVVDYTLDYSTLTEFPFYDMGYIPTFENGVMKASYPGSWYQFFASYPVKTESVYSYTVTMKVKSSKEGTISTKFLWGWGEGECAETKMAVTTEWSEQSFDFHNVADGKCEVVMLPGTFEGDLEFAWIKVTHDDTPLTPARQCLIADRLEMQKATNTWDLSAQYTFPTALEAGTYTLKFDVYGLQAGKGSIWGTVDDAAWYGGGEFAVKANAWNSISKTYTFSGAVSVINLVFGGEENYAGSAIYFDNFSLTKEGSTENLMENGDFKTAKLGNWGRPSYLLYNLYVGNGPAETAGTVDIEAEVDGEPVYYNLQGIRMNGDALPAGVYVKVAGRKAEKIVVR
ncbi:MAG: hypothetical protein NC102_02925 [Clostridium sp.]|nr:hypothetical protein [Clostridium sp.]